MIIAPLVATNWLGIAGIVATASVAILGLIVTGLNQRADRASRASEADAARRHTDELSRADRYFKARLHAYTETGRFLHRSLMVIQRRAPISGPLPEPPKPPSDEEWQALAATITVASSEEVLDAFNECGAKASAFVERANTYEGHRERGEPLDGSGTEMQEARDEAYDVINGTIQMMREELRGL